MTDLKHVEKLRRDHTVEGFDCGREGLNRYLLRYAWQNQQAGAAQTYVGLVGEVIVGYHTLAVGQVTLEDAPERLKKGFGEASPTHHVACPACSRSVLAGPRRWRGAVARRDATHPAGVGYSWHTRIRRASK